MSFVADTSMEDLPEPVMVDILSRLPVKTIIQCKCVCKEWQNIILGSYFADIQLSRSPICFMTKTQINYKDPGILKWAEVKEEVDHHNLHHDPFMSLDLNLTPIFQHSEIYPLGLVDGLLCLRQLSKLTSKPDYTCICNPITREYVILPSQQYSCKPGILTGCYCFGVSSLTQKYKVIRIIQKQPDFTSTFELSFSEADVYTLGTGQWRSIGHVPYQFHVGTGTFFKGRAHWPLLYRNNLPETLCSFDFDMETIDLFPSPPYEEAINERLVVLKGCLCRCDSYRSNLTVWVMKEYGIKKSWHKELVIKYSTIRDFNKLHFEHWYLMHGYKDGTILMRSSRGNLIIYCPRRNTIVESDKSGSYRDILVYRPSFQRLHNFENEKVHVF